METVTVCCSNALFDKITRNRPRDFSIEEKVWSVKKEINNMAAVKLLQLNLDIDPTSVIYKPL